MWPLQLMFAFLIFSPLISAALNAKAGCPDSCGDLPIRYPFGMGSNCSLNHYFNIDCNTSTDPPKAYLSIIKKQVVEINETYIRLRNPYMISACYDLSTDKQHSMTVNLSGTPYMFSGNVLTAIGCDDMLVQIKGSSVIDGSSAFCADKNGTGGVGNYSRNGCCQQSIRGGGKLMEAQLIDLSGKSLREKLFPCSYAFMKELLDDDDLTFSYPLYYLDNTSALLNDDWKSASMAPVVRLDWTIGTDNCSVAKNFKTYACLDPKSICVDIDSSLGVNGYLCSCVQGYYGNPYLSGGCKRISSSIAKAGCLDQCGEISIPFPFGVGPNCFLDSSFEVVCNTTTNPEKPYLRALETEIVEIDSSKVVVISQNMASTCYNLSAYENGITKPEERKLVIDLLKTQFTLSDENWITAIGCNAMLVGGVIGEGKLTSIGSSCAAICSDSISYYNRMQYEYADCNFGRGSNLGDDGCCRVPIPRGTSYLEANLSDLTGQWPRTSFSCNYAFIEYMDRNKDNNYESSFPLFINSSGTRPDLALLGEYFYFKSSHMSLNWRIGAVYCKEARLNRTDYVCQNNTDCVDFDSGYLCNCSTGYKGNPYLIHGCQDIDECSDNTTNTCVSNSICENEAGSYHCTCLKGYTGDGKNDGTGCTLLPPFNIAKFVVIGLASALGLLLLLLLCFWLHKVFEKKRNKTRKEKFFKHLVLQQQTSEGAFGKTKLFTAKELEKATDHFNESRICGRGGQGIVYKGMLSDGTIVAIKKLKEVDENQVEEFINEVVILSQINHKNVVRLFGCCLATNTPQIVYEFLPNGTLFDFIHHPKIEFPLTWNMRLKIVADVAGALAYLHFASSIPIYHRDIKSTNILLDEKYIVKVSDFGISKLVQVDQTHLTTLVKGTFGYLDPEYYETSQYTEKSDVYSFGVVLLELLTSERPISLERPEVGRNLAAHFLSYMEADNLDAILDTQVSEEGGKEEVIAVARLARRCLNVKGKMRPNMKEVATELESLIISQIPESEEATVSEAKHKMFSDIEYTWTNSDHTS